jgi:SAM-dependent methyltransferase
MKDIEYNDSYFRKRYLNDSKRLKSFAQEKKFVETYTNLMTNVCDIGCGTGEFLDYIDWKGNKYGTEVSGLAIREASKRFITIVENVSNIRDNLDNVIMRGSLQHLPSPFEQIASVYQSLKPNGMFFILATPNVDSLYYRIFEDLPALDFPKNYWLPGYRQVKLVCEREGFELVGKNFPYLDSGYATLFDFPKFILKCITRNDSIKFAFPGNMMNLAFRKKSPVL